MFDSLIRNFFENQYFNEIISGIYLEDFLEFMDDFEEYNDPQIKRIYEELMTVYHEDKGCTLRDALSKIKNRIKKLNLKPIILRILKEDDVINTFTSVIKKRSTKSKKHFKEI